MVEGGRVDDGSVGGWVGRVVGCECVAFVLVLVIAPVLDYMSSN